ncbi:MAG: DUF167 domain-containing protein [Phyllobacteriaceae bacterium]|nr:DUF167 domain-containing protein [Nitratireductor sp.]MCO5135344.1 DUF167 domain-containing protein [Phyllobacteriaceae bacterium]
MTGMPYDISGDEIRLRIRLSPGARKEAIGGTWADEHDRLHLKAAVRAVPEKGLANKALIALLAKRTGVAKSLITLESGSTSRSKTLILPREAAAGIDMLMRESG